MKTTKDVDSVDINIVKTHSASQVEMSGMPDFTNQSLGKVPAVSSLEAEMKNGVLTQIQTFLAQEIQTIIVDYKGFQIPFI